MKKILKYTLPAACILALSACQEKLPEPAWEPEQTSEAIGFSTGVVGTKGLIENTEANPDALAKNATRIKVYDYLTGGTDNTTVKYIDDVIKGTDGNNTTVTTVDGVEKVNYAPWSYENATTHYYWTKTGTHKFFGYLTVDPEGTAFNDASMNTAALPTTLTVSGINFTKDTPQVDFLYSNIVTRNAATDSHDPIALQMEHLFTALSVEVSNQTGEVITELAVSFTNIQNQRGATVNYSAAAAAATAADVAIAATYGTGSKAVYAFGGDVTSIPVPEGASYSSPTTATETFIPLYSNTEAKPSNEFRLLWPQDNLQKEGEVAMVQVSCKIGGDASNFLPVAFPSGFSKMEAGKKYLLQITINPIAVYFKIVVDPLVEYYYSDNYTDYLIKF